MQKNNDNEFKYRFKLRGKLFALAIITTLIFATILSTIIYYAYLEQQNSFLQTSLVENTEKTIEIISEHYEKVSSSASDIIKMIVFMYSNNDRIKDLKSFYTFPRFNAIEIYDKNTNKFLSSDHKEISDIKDLNIGINYREKGKSLEIYYVAPFEHYYLIISVESKWFLSAKNYGETDIQTIVNIDRLNKSYMVTETNGVMELKDLNELLNHSYYYEKRIGKLTIYSLVPIAYSLNMVKEKIILPVVLIYSVSFAITLLIVLLMNMLFVKKIRKIVIHISRIKDGDLYHQIELNGNDEISYLAHHINLMTGKLSNLIKGQRNVINEKQYIIAKKLEQEKEINNLIIKLTQSSENAQELLNIVHSFLINKGAKKFFHYRINKEGNAFELLKNFKYPKLPKRFIVSSPVIQKIMILYENKQLDEAKNEIRKLCNTEKLDDQIHLINYKNKLVGFFEIEWSNREDDSIMIPIFKTLPIMINNIYMRESLIKTTKDLLEANKAKTQFLNVMSHELRTPLNAILGFTQMLLRKPDNLTKRQYKYLKNIYSAGNSLLELINDILDLSKIQSGKIEIRISKTDIHSIVKDILTILKPLSKEKNIDLKETIEIKEKIVYSDEIALKHIITNLLSNAIKYTPAGGKVWLSIYIENGILKIAVKDTGIGISEDKISYIFEPFKRLQKDEYASNMKGTGLGLAIVKEYVELLSGKIEVKSKVGNGSTFTVTLPVKEIIFPTHIEENCSSDTLLIIDSSKEDIELYKNIFESHYNLIISKSLQDAVNVFEYKKPKVIITDIQLPDLSGIYLINKIKENPEFKCTDIIVCSRLDKRDIPGLKYYIQKPLKDVLKLQELVENLMG